MEFFMRMKLILGVMVLGFTACSNKKTVDTNPVVRDNIIHLSTAIKNVREEMIDIDTLAGSYKHSIRIMNIKFID